MTNTPYARESTEEAGDESSDHRHSILAYSSYVSLVPLSVALVKFISSMIYWGGPGGFSFGAGMAYLMFVFVGWPVIAGMICLCIHNIFKNGCPVFVGVLCWMLSCYLAFHFMWPNSGS